MSKWVVVAEDDPTLGGIVRATLESAGYRVKLVDSGEECLRLAYDAEPAAVVMDVSLAGEMNGIEAAARLRRRCGCPVIFHTAHSSPERRARMAEVRNSTVVQKPADISRLVEAVTRAVG